VCAARIFDSVGRTIREASTWPHPRDIIERDFRDASELEKRKIVREKVVQLYGFDLEADRK
jgi:hypothetical protein